MEEKNLSPEQLKGINTKVEELKKEKNLKKVIPIVVFGDPTLGERELYVAYMRSPNVAEFSKFMAASKKDEVIAMRQLAKDCFLDGDKDLYDNDDLFLFGLMGELSGLITTRQTAIANLSLAGK